MITFKFKTNINCDDCISIVTPFLEEKEYIENWNVDTNSPDKILTVSERNITPDIIIKTIDETGFNAVLIE